MEKEHILVNCKPDGFKPQKEKEMPKSTKKERQTNKLS